MENHSPMYANNCVKIDDETRPLRDEVKMLEISEAINDIDSKLTDLEIALHMGNHQDNCSN